MSLYLKYDTYIIYTQLVVDMWGVPNIKLCDFLSRLSFFNIFRTKLQHRRSCHGPFATLIIGPTGKGYRIACWTQVSLVWPWLSQTPTRDWNDEGRGIVAVRGSPLTCVMNLLARFSRAQRRICSMAAGYRETLGLSCKLNDWNTNIPTGTLPLGRHASVMCGWTSDGSPQN